ncbi:MAG: hypothetical protein R3Y28_08205 [Candidatus Gastranaerophilales bacterium]
MRNKHTIILIKHKIEQLHTLKAEIQQNTKEIREEIKQVMTKNLEIINL